MMHLKKYRIQQYSFLFLFAAIALSVFGILVIRSATAGTAEADIYTRQIMGLVIGVVCAGIVSLIDYHLYIRLFPLVYLVCCGLLLAVLLIGETHGGATRWLVLPVLGQIQPSEFSKIFLILFWAALLSLLEEHINKVWALALILALSAVPLFLIVKEPDLSTTITCALIFVTMVYAAKISYKWIAGVLGVIIPYVGVFFWYLLSHEEELAEKYYMCRRILAFLKPSKYADLYYQQENSMMAIGSGGLTGKGLNNTTFESVKNGNFLSEAQTDFIFAVVGEELGFIGSCAVIALMAILVLICLNLARKAPDSAGRLICCGFAALLGFQTFINICVATGMMPNTGIPLPFVSYGLSSLLSIFIGVGVVLNVGLQRSLKN